MSERLVPISISRILVAFDGSDHARKAAELGVHLAVMWNAELCLVHVVEESRIPESFKKYAKIERVSPLDYFDELSKHQLRPAVERAKAAGVKKVESVSLHGDPADEILRSAKIRNVDLIILGSRGLGGFSRTFLGSVSTKILTYAKCTCIVVK